MGSLSIWHWMVVFIILMPIIPLFMASKVQVLGRQQYFRQIFASFALTIGAGFAGVMIPSALDNSDAYNFIGALGMLLVFVASIALFCFIMLWSVYRIQDVGWSRWLNLLMFIPYLNMMWVIILMCVPSKSTASGA